MRDENGLTIRNPKGDIASLERRKRFLDAKIAEERGSFSALDYDRQESRALKSATRAIRHHVAQLSAETSPALVLREILDEMERLDLPSYTDDHKALRRLAMRGRTVLEALAP
jgi:hypothetical protein